MIGLYLTIGTLGGAAGPPLVQALVAAGGWRFYWLAAAAIAVLLAVFCCATVIREPPAMTTHLEASAQSGFPTARAALLSIDFAVIAAAMLITQLCLLTISGIAPAHLAALKWQPEMAARFLGAQGFIGAIGTAGAGWCADRIHPRTMQAASLLALAAGVALLAYAGNALMLAAACFCFGLGWSVACVAITLYLIRLFGQRSGTTALSAIWMLSGPRDSRALGSRIMGRCQRQFRAAASGTGVAAASLRAGNVAAPHGGTTGQAGSPSFLKKRGKRL